MTTTNTLDPSKIFTDLMDTIKSHRESAREKSRRSSKKWRAKQNPNLLKERQRHWEKKYRQRLKASNPERYSAYCKGNVNGIKNSL